MAAFVTRSTLLAALIALQAASAGGADELAKAYSAILQGDYAGGRSTVDRLIETGPPSEEVLQGKEWLRACDASVAARDERRRQSFDWAVDAANLPIAEGAQVRPLGLREPYSVRNAGDAVPNVLDQQNPLGDAECEEVTDGKSFYHGVSPPACWILFKSIQA